MIAGCQRAAEEQGIAQGAIFETVMTGATQAYLGLAYNLYLLAEYAELKERLIARLRHPDQFHGAYYETFVEAWFILAGFELMLDDERNGCTDHGEFLARSRVSGRTYWVEAKSRANNDKGHLDISLQLRRALEKKDVVHDRIVMIDVNVPHEPTRSESEWKAELTRAIRSREADLIVNGATAPPAVVFATNFPFHHDLTAIAPVANMLLEGFKITDLGSAVRVGNTIEAFRLRLKYDDMHRLETAMEDYAVPSFFEPPDASLAGLDALGQRWKIGQYVGLPETHNPGLKGAKGFLIAAGVAEQERFVYLRFRLADGLVVQTRAPMGEVELENYRKMGPKTYFGGANILSPVDMFAFFHGLAAPMPRRMLLTTLTNDPGARASMLRCSSTRELRLLFAEREVRRTMGMNFVAVSALRPDVAAG